MDRNKALRHWYNTAQGKVVGRQLQERLKKMWPTPSDGEVLVIGATCLCKTFFPDDMQQHITAINSQRAAENLPFEDKRFDYIFVAHTLEFLSDSQALLEECLRCLVPSGKLMVMAPNRLSAWTRAEQTPFGVGKPYTALQLKSEIEEVGFVLGQADMALFVPPLSMQCVLKRADTFEKIGRVLRPWCAIGGGVLFCEGVKKVVGGTPALSKRKIKTRVRPAFGAAKIKP